MKLTIQTLVIFVLTSTFTVLVVAISSAFILRESANDPQSYVVADLASKFKNGVVAATDYQNIDISYARGPFIAFFNDQQKITYSSAKLNGSEPVLSEEIFSIAKSKGEYRFTWEPESGKRFVTTIRYYEGASNGYVMGGRSVVEVEQRIGGVLAILFVCWGIFNLLILCTYFYTNKKRIWLLKKKKITQKGNTHIQKWL
jgi:hypothetical protein